MSFLTRPLPRSISVAGQEYPVRTDFRIWLKFDEVISGSGDVLEKAEEIIKLCMYPGKLPSDGAELLLKLVDFYVTDFDKQVAKKTNKTSGTIVQVINYEYDAVYIYASFLEQYGIDLVDIEHLHWWKFQALFKGLSENSKIVKIMGYRSIDIGNIKDKKQRQLYEKLKSNYALPDLRCTAEKESTFAESLSKLF